MFCFQKLAAIWVFVSMEKWMLDEAFFFQRTTIIMENVSLKLIKFVT